MLEMMATRDRSGPVLIHRGGRRLWELSRLTHRLWSLEVFEAIASRIFTRITH